MTSLHSYRNGGFPPANKLLDKIWHHEDYKRHKKKVKILLKLLSDFVKSINKVHQYQTRLAIKISYYLRKARINYDKFNIRLEFIEDSLKSKSRSCFKNLLKELLISNY